MKPKLTRCAIYTRKSCEEGLEQEFNSLDAQREASEAYIKSQKHEGWELVPTEYDDGGFSGGNMERPALRQLMADIESGKIDVVVVYKVDRLSRALSDFAKMVDVFDKHEVSFVSVTQQFNTTTSMGRLTLNVLLSFAQFEREVTGERIRDKFAASKKKGMWMGGPQPLGYDVVERKLIVNAAEAEIVKFIFQYYATKPISEPLRKLLEQLKAKGWKNKSYTSQKGNVINGKEFGFNQIYSILNNPIYNGKIKHKALIYDGEHTAIIDDELWAKAHSKINKKEFVKSPTKKSEQPKLVGKIFDYLGNRLSATYSYKYSASGRYKMRYYVNRQIIGKGKTDSEFRRIRAEHIDDIVETSLLQLLQTLITAIAKSHNNELSANLLHPLKCIIPWPTNFLSKIILFPQHMELLLQLPPTNATLSKTSVDELQQMLSAYDAKIITSEQSPLTIKFNIKAHYKKSAGQLHIYTETGHKLELPSSPEYQHPTDPTFIFLTKSFYWNKMIDNGIHKTPTEISRIDAHNIEYTKRAIRQKFLSPKIIQYITSKTVTIQIPFEKLATCQHWDWQKQEQTLLKTS
jgi:DNA invertase Pin-like site-specific DNA recombinase